MLSRYWSIESTYLTIRCQYAICKFVCRQFSFISHICTLVIGIYNKIFTTKLFRIGPPQAGEKELSFFGKPVTSWYTVVFIITYCFVNQIINSHHNNMYYPFITHNIQTDEPRTLNMSKSQVYTMMNLENIFSWISYFIDLNILFTMELQFILPRMIASVMMHNISIKKYLCNKTFNW